MAALSLPARAGIAQLVEHDLAKVGVASSSLVSRSNFCVRSERNDEKAAFRGCPFNKSKTLALPGFCFYAASAQCGWWVESISLGLVAEWSCSGLQIRVRRFDSDPGLQVRLRSPAPRHGR